ncbi:MAG TPA: hypothetical protein VLG49_05535, partial [Rhabdochlamydiaceae bacterium]|nr:hypothetical protein [Rhabdochlamydiaceae bacterium]
MELFMSIFNINGVGPYIKSFLTPKDLVVSERVSKQWEKDAQNPGLWKQYGYESKNDFKCIFEESMKYVQSLRRSSDDTLKIKHYVKIIKGFQLKEMLEQKNNNVKGWYFTIGGIKTIVLGIFTPKEINDMDPEDRRGFLTGLEFTAITQSIFTPKEIKEMSKNDRDHLITKESLEMIKAKIHTPEEILMIKAKIHTPKETVRIQSNSLVGSFDGLADLCLRGDSGPPKKMKRGYKMI